MSFKKGHFSRPSQELAHHDSNTRNDDRKRGHIPNDQIDALDNILGSYHHEGPFDATLQARQQYRAPLDALKYTTQKAIAHTDPDSLRRSIATKTPLDGVAKVGGVPLKSEVGEEVDIEDVGDSHVLDDEDELDALDFEMKTQKRD